MSPITTSFAAVFARHARDRFEHERGRSDNAKSEDADNDSPDGAAGQPADDHRDGNDKAASED